MKEVNCSTLGSSYSESGNGNGGDSELFESTFESLEMAFVGVLELTM